MHYIKCVGLACLLASLAACSTGRTRYMWHDLGAGPDSAQGQATLQKEDWGSQLPPDSLTDPQLRPGYLLALRFLEDQLLNGSFRIDFDGSLSLPYNVKIATNGMTLSGLEEKLKEVYRPFFKKASDIKVKVSERKLALDLRGLVEKPGSYLVDEHASIDQVIGLAGGLPKVDPPGYLRIQKDNVGLVIDLEQYFRKGSGQAHVARWQGGEVVFLQKDAGSSFADVQGSRKVVTILGEVRKPGEFGYKTNADFLYYFTQAAGFTEVADLDQIELIRRDGTSKKAYVFEWERVGHAPEPREGDVIVIHADQSGKVGRGLQKAGLFSSIIVSLLIVLKLFL